MNPHTGELYDSVEDAIKAGERKEDLVEITGDIPNVMAVSAAVKESRRRKAKVARKSRKKNRK